MFFRGFTIWLLIICAESINGTIREMLIAPLIGNFYAKILSFVCALFLIFFITYFFISWIAADSVKFLLYIGLTWVVLTASFELCLGLLGFNYSLERIFEDYNIARGGLMGFGLMFMFFVPWLAAKSRR